MNKQVLRILEISAQSLLKMVTEIRHDDHELITEWKK